MYCERNIDKYLADWASAEEHKPVLLRGARQVGKSTVVRHLGQTFTSFVEINFEKQPEYKSLFKENLDVNRITSQMAAIYGEAIVPGETLLFLDEVQECPEAIMSLRFFKEDMSQLHVIAAGSLLEFALSELPTFGVGRIHSMFMHPMSFDEFLKANGEDLLLNARNGASCQNPLPEVLHNKLVQLLRTYMLVGGMPEVVCKWVTTHDYLKCQVIQDDIITSYEDDFAKYKKKVNPLLLRMTLRSTAMQMTQKFVYAQVGGEFKTHEVKQALEMLILAGLIIPVTQTTANGIPLGCEANSTSRKMLILDTGLMLSILNMTLGSINEVTTQILTASAADLVNKGPMAELLAGLEMLRNQSPNRRHEMYYWTRQAKNSLAEIDYVTIKNMKVLPIEVKAGTQGGMKSLWAFMRAKNLSYAVRCSLENFGTFDYIDNEDGGAIRCVDVCPLYAISMMNGF